jgi:hypothetical protein
MAGLGAVLHQRLVASHAGMARPIHGTATLGFETARLVLLYLDSTANNNKS